MLLQPKPLRSNEISSQMRRQTKPALGENFITTALFLQFHFPNNLLLDFIKITPICKAEVKHGSIYKTELTGLKGGFTADFLMPNAGQQRTAVEQQNHDNLNKILQKHQESQNDLNKQL